MTPPLADAVAVCTAQLSGDTDLFTAQLAAHPDPAQLLVDMTALALTAVALIAQREGVEPAAVLARIGVVAALSDLELPPV